MIDHVSLGVRSLHDSAAFYDRVLATLGFTRQADEEHTIGYGRKYPEFWLNARPQRLQEPDDSGLHVCLRARTPDIVRAFHAAALEAGAGDDGGPGMRPEYSPAYYAAFVRDPDGHRIEIVTFVEEPETLTA